MIRAKDGLSIVVDKVKDHHPRAKTEVIKKAFDYATQAQPRTDTSQGHFVYPLAVANILADLRLDVSSVCAGILHNIVGDGVATVRDIQTAFGEEVAFLVDGVTKLDRLIFTSHEDEQAESFRKMLVAIARDIRVVLVKLADRLHTMRILHSMTREAQTRIATETREIYAPLAHRLGIQWLKVDFEDLTFRYLEPEAFADLEAQVSAVAEPTDQYITEVVAQIENMLHSRGLEIEVRGRRKHLYSLHKKMLSRGIQFPEVKDFVAFRVTTDTVADCYAVLGIVHAEWTPIQGRFKDYIAVPKPNKYQSLHTTVLGPSRRRVEIQIRTHAMHRTAEYGIAAHWLYKDHAGEVDPKDVARFAWLRELTDSQRHIGDWEAMEENLHREPFAEDVYVFTSDGDVETLPRGATPVDFAYAVGKEVGHRCAGARVNGSIVPIRHKLQNGDVVEVITHRHHQPNEHWLEFVATDYARARIRENLRGEDTPRVVRDGRELLDEEFERRHVSQARFWNGPHASKVLGVLGVRDEQDLYGRIGRGELGSGTVLDAVNHADGLVPEPGAGRGPLGIGSSPAPRLRVAGMDDVVVHLAKCCRPVPGDAVIGWITHGRGVSVHRADCRRLLALEPARRVAASWESVPVDADSGSPDPK
ncbi:MAG: RelA/SpoT family protein [Myxococcota bacterium]